MPTAPLVVLALSLAQSSILHEPISCLSPGHYPEVDAVIGPSGEVRSAKVYFRSDKYPKYYYVEMAATDGGFHGLLPRPSPETSRIVYYIEAVDVTFASTVGEEHAFEIRPDCSETREANDEAVPPEITVGSVDGGGPALPPGFEAAGVIGTIASTGVLTGLGGGSGVGVGTALAVGGGIAAGAGGVVAATSRGDEGPQNEPGPTPSGGTSSPEPPASSGPSTPAPTPSPTPAPTPNPTPTPTPTPGPPTPSSVTACFAVSFPGNSCNMKLDAGCSAGAIQAWDWLIDAGSALGGPSPAVGQTVNRTFPQCSGETVTVTLTVASAAGAKDSITKSVTLPTAHLEYLPPTPESSCTFVSELSYGFDGRVVVDASRIDGVTGGTPSTHAMSLASKNHGIEAFESARRAGDGIWSFDFSGCGSSSSLRLEVVSGQLVGSDGRRVVFRVEGASEPLRFRVILSR